MKRTASECSDNDVFFDDGDMLKDGSVALNALFVYSSMLSYRSLNEGGIGIQ